MMAVDEVRNYLENGSILHSVNYPDVDAGAVAAKRVCVLHKNIPNVLTKLSAIVSGEGVNIENMLSKSKGERHLRFRQGSLRQGRRRDSREIHRLIVLFPIVFRLITLSADGQDNACPRGAFSM